PLRTVLAERDAVVRDAERRVGQALLAMTDEEGLLPGHRAAAQEVGMSAPPSWESRWPNRTYVGCGANLPPAKLSPCRNVVARWIRPAGGKEKAPGGEPRSASEFIRISSRLSHWDNTSSCTFCGLWVEVSRYSPNFRPSAAVSAA